MHSLLGDEYYMTRRAFRSKSNSLVGGIWGQLGANFLVTKRPLCQDFSKSVSSIDLGVFFSYSYWQDLANEPPMVSGAMLGKKYNLLEVGRLIKK